MLRIMFLLTFVLTCIYFTIRKRKLINFKDKKILIIGGTSGLGLALSKILNTKNAIVTVASRSRRNIVAGTKFIHMDLLDHNSFSKIDLAYDFIFCCAGSSKPGYFKDLNIKDFSDQMNLNYLGPINALHHFLNYNTKPFSYIFISSTAALFTFPGYSAYSPSKCALKSFYESAYLEMKKEGIDLYIYYTTSINSPGFEDENKLKPAFTKSIEGEKGMLPELAALKLLNGMGQSNTIFSDVLTKIFAHDPQLNGISDVLYIILAFFFCPIAKFYVTRRFKGEI